MAKRKQTDRVQLPIRLRESLRAKLEKAAKRHGVSLNAEVVERLERSAYGAEALITEVLGSRERLLFALFIADAIDQAEKETGRDWLDDDLTFGRVGRAIFDWIYRGDPAADLRELREDFAARLRRFE